jgi:saccharopine dehydrogenase-like NADP-dependent oxidoreductase
MPTAKSPRNLKICILGGCAAMAAPALRELAQEKGVEAVTLADRNAEAAEALAKTLGPRFRASACDAMNHDELVKVIEGHDVVMGYIGPFYLFEERIIKACAEARVHYVSISDDFDAYLKAEPLFDLAKDAGITVITGLGNSPGLTNLLAKKGYDSMDAPKRINVNWTGGSDEEVGPANVLHVMHIFEGETLQWLNGQEVRVKTGRGRKIVEFPEPIGIGPVFYTGHAESVSLPRNLKGLEEVTLHGGVRPVWVAYMARTFGDLGMTTTHKRRTTLAKAIAPLMNIFKMGGSADKSVFRIDVHGSHKGKPRHHFYTGVGPIAEITSMPCLEGALMVGRGEIRNRGVFAPEAILNPKTFLPRMAARGVTLTYYEGISEA